MNSYRNDSYNSQGGYQGQGQYNNNNEGRRWSICLTSYKKKFQSPEYPFKDQIDLKFCTKCGVGDHSLEYCSIMLEKIMSKRNVNHLLWVQRNDVINTKSIWIITEQGTMVGDDKTKSSSTTLQNYEHPNKKVQK